MKMGLFVTFFQLFPTALPLFLHCFFTICTLFLDRFLRVCTVCSPDMAWLRLTPLLSERATSNMKMGYQRELTYRHADGSFSAFGPSDGSGSTWLTAFVLKVFAQVRPTFS
jgi:hypothetical protein